VAVASELASAELVAEQELQQARKMVVAIADPIPAVEAARQACVVVLLAAPGEVD